GTLNANRIGAQSITAAKLATNAVTAEKINANAVTANKIAANAVTAGKISVDNLAAITANLGTVRAGRLEAVELIGATGTFTGNLKTEKDIEIGNNIIVGHRGSSAQKRIIFNDNANITAYDTFISVRGSRVSLGGMHDISISQTNPRAPSSGISLEEGEIYLYSDLRMHLDSKQEIFFNAPTNIENELRFLTNNSSHRIQTGSDNSFVFAGNRAVGNPFEVKSHNNTSSYRTDFYINPSDGIMVSPPSANRTSTLPANMRIAESNGFIVRTSSYAKYKILIEHIESDYNDIMKLVPRDWIDKNNAELYADYMTGNSQLLTVCENIMRVPGLVAEEVERAG